MTRKYAKLEDSIAMMPRLFENKTDIDFKHVYPQPAQVPLGEKPKSCKDNLCKGIRQISHKPSVNVVPRLFQ